MTQATGMGGAPDPDRQREQAGEDLGEVSPLLEQCSAPVARDAYRSDLRAQFLSGQFEDASLSETSESDADLEAVDDSDESISELEKLLRNLLDRFGLPQARMKFRLVLGRRFQHEESQAPQVTARDSRPAHSIRPVAKRTSTAKRGPRALPRAADQSKAGSPRILVAAILAAAAAILVMVFGPSPATGPVWRLWPDQDLRHLRIDGQEVANLSLDELAQQLSTAQQLEALGGDVRLGFGRLLAVELAAGSLLTVGSMRDPQLGQIEMSGTRGAFRFATGPDFKPQGIEFLFHSPDANVSVVGTVFGVDIFDGEGTCICCNEGEIKVVPVVLFDPLKILPHAVPAENMCLVHAEGSAPPMHGSIVADHRPPLISLAADAEQLWAGEAGNWAQR